MKSDRTGGSILSAGQASFFSCGKTPNRHRNKTAESVILSQAFLWPEYRILWLRNPDNLTKTPKEQPGALTGPKSNLKVDRAWRFKPALPQVF